MKRRLKMATAYSYDLRVRAISLIDSGIKKTSVAKMLNICRSTLYDWLKLAKEKNDLHAKENWQVGYGHKITDLKAFKEFVDENNNLTLDQMEEKLGNVDRSSIGRAMKKIGYVKKKDIWLHGARRKS
jgi:transposase